jgi:hypothetical protein
MSPTLSLLLVLRTVHFRFVAAPGTSVVLRYDGTAGAFKNVFVAGDSGGLQFPMFMTFTETNPTTLNYVRQTSAPSRRDATRPNAGDGGQPLTRMRFPGASFAPGCPRERAGAWPLKARRIVYGPSWQADARCE